MKKLVCPCCGWSDFLKYEGIETIYCLACGFECTEYDVMKFEQDAPEEDGDYGITVIDQYRNEYKNFNGHRSDAYYEEWIKEAEERENNPNREADDLAKKESKEDWQVLEGPSPFDQ